MTYTALAPVTVADFKKMDIDWSGHLDHDIPNYWEIVVDLSVTVGIYQDGELLCFAGGVPDGTGILSLYFITSKRINELRTKKNIIRYAGTGLQILQRYFNPHRIQCIVNPENAFHVSFVEHFGFKCEGILEFYTSDGKSAAMYARRGFQ